MAFRGGYSSVRDLWKNKLGDESDPRLNLQKGPRNVKVGYRDRVEHPDGSSTDKTLQAELKSGQSRVGGATSKFELQRVNLKALTKPGGNAGERGTLDERRRSKFMQGQDANDSRNEFQRARLKGVDRSRSSSREDILDESESHIDDSQYSSRHRDSRSFDSRESPPKSRDFQSNGSPFNLRKTDSRDSHSEKRRESHSHDQRQNQASWIKHGLKPVGNKGGSSQGRDFDDEDHVDSRANKSQQNDHSLSRRTSKFEQQDHSVNRQSNKFDQKRFDQRGGSGQGQDFDSEDYVDNRTNRSQHNDRSSSNRSSKLEQQDHSVNRQSNKFDQNRLDQKDSFSENQSDRFDQDHHSKSNKSNKFDRDSRSVDGRSHKFNQSEYVDDESSSYSQDNRSVKNKSGKFNQSDRPVDSRSNKFNQSEYVDDESSLYSQDNRSVKNKSGKFNQSDRSVGNRASKFEQDDRSLSNQRSKFEKDSRSVSQKGGKFEQGDRSVGNKAGRFEQDNRYDRGDAYEDEEEETLSRRSSRFDQDDRSTSSRSSKFGRDDRSVSSKSSKFDQNRAFDNRGNKQSRGGYEENGVVSRYDPNQALNTYNRLGTPADNTVRSFEQDSTSLAAEYEDGNQSHRINESSSKTVQEERSDTGYSSRREESSSSTKRTSTTFSQSIDYDDSDPRGHSQRGSRGQPHPGGRGVNPQVLAHHIPVDSHSKPPHRQKKWQSGDRGSSSDDQYSDYEDDRRFGPGQHKRQGKYPGDRRHPGGSREDQTTTKTFNQSSKNTSKRSSVVSTNQQTTHETDSFETSSHSENRSHSKDQSHRGRSSSPVDQDYDRNRFPNRSKSVGREPSHPGKNPDQRRSPGRDSHHQNQITDHDHRNSNSLNTKSRDSIEIQVHNERRSDDSKSNVSRVNVNVNPNAKKFAVGNLKPSGGGKVPVILSDDGAVEIQFKVDNKNQLKVDVDSTKSSSGVSSLSPRFSDNSASPRSGGTSPRAAFDKQPSKVPPKWKQPQSKGPPPRGQQFPPEEEPAKDERYPPDDAQRKGKQSQLNELQSKYKSKSANEELLKSIRQISEKNNNTTKTNRNVTEKGILKSREIPVDPKPEVFERVDDRHQKPPGDSRQLKGQGPGRGPGQGPGQGPLSQTGTRRKGLKAYDDVPPEGYEIDPDSKPTTTQAPSGKGIKNLQNLFGGGYDSAGALERPKFKKVKSEEPKPKPPTPPPPEPEEPKPTPKKPKTEEEKNLGRLRIPGKFEEQANIPPQVKLRPWKSTENLGNKKLEEKKRGLGYSQNDLTEDALKLKNLRHVEEEEKELSARLKKRTLRKVEKQEDSSKRLDLDIDPSLSKIEQARLRISRMFEQHDKKDVKSGAPKAFIINDEEEEPKDIPPKRRNVPKAFTIDEKVKEKVAVKDPKVAVSKGIEDRFAGARRANKSQESTDEIDSRECDSSERNVSKFGQRFNSNEGQVDRPPVGNKFEPKDRSNKFEFPFGKRCGPAGNNCSGDKNGSHGCDPPGENCEPESVKNSHTSKFPGGNGGPKVGKKQEDTNGPKVNGVQSKVFQVDNDLDAEEKARRQKKKEAAEAALHRLRAKFNEHHEKSSKGSDSSNHSQNTEIKENHVNEHRTLPPNKSGHTDHSPLSTSFHEPDDIPYFGRDFKGKISDRISKLRVKIEDSPDSDRILTGRFSKPMGSEVSAEDYEEEERSSSQTDHRMTSRNRDEGCETISEIQQDQRTKRKNCKDRERRRTSVLTEDEEATAMITSMTAMEKASASNGANVPEFTRQLRDQTCMDGDSVFFQCHVVGHPAPEIRWLKDGEVVKKQKDIKLTYDGSVATLVIGEAYLDDEGEYTCEAENCAGKAVSSCALLVEEPDDAERVKGQRSANNRHSSIDDLVADNASTSTTEDRHRQHDHMEGDVSDQSSERSGRRVQRESAPSFIIKPRRQFADEGTTAKFKASFDGEPPPEARWEKDGKPVTSGDKYKIVEKNDFHFLEVLDVCDGDKGNYTCVLTNALGKVSASATLEVYATTRWKSTKNLPKLEKELSDLTVTDSDKATLECVITGTTEPKIEWYKNGKLMRPSSDIKQMYNGRTAKLIFPEVFPEDAGKYECVGKTPDGDVKTSAMLTVTAKPRKINKPRDIPPTFTKHPLSQTVMDGDKVVLECTVAGQPQPKVKWLRGQKEVKNSGDFKISFDGTTARLVIKEVFPEDNGEYTCLVENSAGEVRAKCRLTVKVPEETAKENAPPPLPKTSAPPLHTAKQTESAKEKPVTKPKAKPEVKSPPPEVQPKTLERAAPPKVEAKSSVEKVIHNESKVESKVEKNGNIERSIHKEQTVKKESGPTSKSIVQTQKTTMSYKSSLRTEMDPAAKPLAVEPKEKEKEVSPKPSEPTSKPSRGFSGPPTFVKKLIDLTVIDGDKVEMVVEVQGAKPIDVVWLHNDKEIKKASSVYKMVKEGSLHKLLIPEVFPEDGGLYVCEAYNTVGDEDCTCMLTVKDPPAAGLTNQSEEAGVKQSKMAADDNDDAGGDEDEDELFSPEFIKRPKGAHIDEGTSCKFIASVIGNPPPVVWWEKDGKELENGGRFKVTAAGEDFTFEIPHTLATDAGRYVCVAKNAEGTEKCSVSLNVKELENSEVMDFRGLLKSRPGVHAPKKAEFKKPSAGQSNAPAFRSVLKTRPQLKNITGGSGSDSEKEAEQVDFRGVLAPAQTAIDVASPFPGVDPEKGGDQVDFRGVLHQTSSPHPDEVRQKRLGREAEQIDFRNVITSSGTTDDELESKRKALAMPEQVDFREVIKRKSSTISEERVMSPEADQVDFRHVITKKSTVEIEEVVQEKRTEVEQEHVDFRAALRSPRSSIAESRSGDNESEAEQQDFRKVLTRHVQTKQRPKVKKDLHDVTVCEGDQVKLECHVVGIPPPRIRWYHQKKEIKESKYFQMVYEDEIARLTIAEVYPEDEGEYMCIASNEAGRTQSSCDIVVHELRSDLEESPRESKDQSSTMEPPCIEDLSPDNIHLLRGDKFQLRGKFVGTPRPNIIWLQDKNELKSGGRIKIDFVRDTSILTVSDTLPNDSGRYTLVVENEYGRDTCSSSVTVEDRPVPPGQPAASSITGTGLTLSWYGPSYDGGSIVTDYRVEMCVPGQDWKTLTSTCKYTSYQVKNLTPNTEYIFRISAANKHGFSEPSKASDMVVTIDRSLSSFKFDELPFEPRDVEITPDRKFGDFYMLAEEIGKGRFGNVYKCIEKSTRREFAAKFIRVKPSERADMKQEMAVMNELHHPKLLMLYDAFESPRDMVLVMEHVAGGELFERIIDDDYILTERECVHFMRQICDAVKYMHESNILHLDMKPENILCITANSNEIKIIDFGLARKFNPKKSIRVLFGTPEFCAPEVVNYEQIGYPTDMWSVGVICYILMSGLSPFMGDNEAETLSNVTGATWDFEDEAFDEISEDAKSFIEDLLLKQPKKRLLAAECLEHKWLSQDVKYMKAKRLSTDKHKRYMARRKWQKTGNAIRALGRMASLQRQLSSSSRQSSVDLPPSPLTTPAHSRQSSTNSEESATPGRQRVPPPVAPKRTSTIADGSPAEPTDSGIELEAKTNTKEALSSSEDEKGSSRGNRDQKESFTTKISMNSKNEEESRSNGHIGNKEKSQKSHLDDEPNNNTNATAPQFVTPMRDFEVFEGDSARFDVKVTGDPEPEVIWLKEGTELKEGRKHMMDYYDDGACSLIIKNCGEDDDAVYECRAKNSAGEVSCSAELYVEDAC